MQKQCLEVPVECFGITMPMSCLLPIMYLRENVKDVANQDVVAAPDTIAIHEGAAGQEGVVAPDVIVVMTLD